MRFDRQAFFDAYTAAFGAPKQGQRDGLDALLSAVEADPEVSDLRWLAYMFATVKHECADTWKAIEEYGKGKGREYGKPVPVTDPQGRSYTNVYYGRGYVQLTWDYNYRTMGNALGNRLLYEPSLALEADVAYRIMSHGMRKGSFTGKKLADYINDRTTDYVNARRIINGLDQAERIAGYAAKLETILRGSAVAAVPGGVPVIAPQPAAPAPASAASSSGGSGATYTVNASALNIRTAPEKTAPLAASALASGTVVRSLGQQAEWMHVAVQGSQLTGWVAAQYLLPVAPASAGEVLTVNASALNIRTSPDKTAATVAGSPLPSGTVVEALEHRGEWVRVTAHGSVNGVAGVTGWVAAQYLLHAAPAALG